MWIDKYSMFKMGRAEHSNALNYVEQHFFQDKPRKPRVLKTTRYDDVLFECTKQTHFSLQIKLIKK